MAESPNFGTHKLSCFKHRHLGSDYMRAIQPVRLVDDVTLARNSIYLNFDNFNITEVGDLVDLVRTQSTDLDINLNSSPDLLPDI